MRLSQMLFVTLREDPAEAEIPSHKLLLRAGYIRRIGSGIYAYLPLMWRVLKKVSQIVREEMDATGAQECLLPQLQPADLWRESGRWDTYTQAEGIMFAMKDRQQREVGLGPTHEEVITTIAKDMIRSYRQLPVHLYQIQTKFRDEIRPRFGLMRGREFIMKDGYSFHTSEESLKKTYQDMAQAYSNMLRRSGLEFRAVDADSGAIGGSGSQEFMVLAEAGEDEVLYTEDGQYAANVEKAVSMPADAQASPFASFEKRETPGTETIAKLCKFLKCSPTQVVKNVLYQAVYDNGMTVLVLVSIRGDQDVNQVKLLNELTKLAGNYQAKTILFLTVPDAEAQRKWAAKSLPLGYMAPDVADDYIAGSKEVNSKFLRLVDRTAVDLTNFVTGSNESGYHVVGANWGKEFQLPATVVGVRTAKKSDRAVHNPEQTLQTARGIEVGHIFQLGTKYSQAMGATYTSEQGEEMPFIMGCYGVGVSRLAQSAVEQSYDKDGIIWPVAIAPYHAIISIPNISDAQQVEVAEKLYNELNQSGIETLLDDRDERAGVKFKDADLIGIPYRIVPGRSVKLGKVEVVERATHKAHEILIEEVNSTLKQWIDAAIK
ncbi:MAG: proline--tRNA ligase [Microcoleus sp. PH2017_01_SCD_O_A]|uniref:proline--tRNA ligase n=1 Tax=unclassified Microcoleus TaxID=2642155 RepID=UPI001D38006B|nr:MULTISPECIES: proline--tRNA ligase [unclassified Microcoleus]TAF85203.1 MAG: proline--tRNA ligase [Oscillatoriales cyanobacterium]MCC3425537.1 proline--tRNA ligase [Microcoleus sp. PH2017_01_SCD_O_A]MCC3448675.1 proline--tRNA ligase [Microcoleus sp. PH2017_09_SFU_O_A]MCC3586812.1 proline--tRNA ligase [Microcoleus sp. PH2017_30_WIL_O_A]MCC3629473.1 proline--tRNA ligase [Microcoleus sp. PH2017_39_LGB_O_B]